MSMEQRKLAFWELDRGKFAREVQARFEKAQQVSFEDEVPSTITIKIKVQPPDQNDLQFSTLDYSVTLAHGSKSVSKSQSIELDIHGNIIADGRDPAEILQIPLDLPTLESLNRTNRKAS
jgi:hypothetical protein